MKFNIRNVAFLECFNEIEKGRDIHVYRFLEGILYGEVEEKYEDLEKQLKEAGPQRFVEKLKQIFPTDYSFQQCSKRKNIKESMIENYVIRNSEDKSYYEDLKLKISLKKISSKDIIIENGDIVHIKF